MVLIAQFDNLGFKPLYLEVKPNVSVPKMLVIIPHCTVKNVHTPTADAVGQKLKEAVGL